MVTLERYEQAELDLTRAEWRRGFWIHAVVYAVVTTGLIVLNVVLAARTDSDFLWFPFPLIGGGIGLAMHYLHGVRWAEREIRARQARIEDLAGGAR